MTNEEPQNIKKYLAEFCLSLPHALPMSFGLVCDDEVRQLSVCPCNNKMGGCFK